MGYLWHVFLLQHWFGFHWYQEYRFIVEKCSEPIINCQLSAPHMFSWFRGLFQYKFWVTHFSVLIPGTDCRLCSKGRNKEVANTSLFSAFCIVDSHYPRAQVKLECLGEIVPKWYIMNNAVFSSNLSWEDTVSCGRQFSDGFPYKYNSTRITSAHVWDSSFFLKGAIAAPEKLGSSPFTGYDKYHRSICRETKRLDMDSVAFASDAVGASFSVSWTLELCKETDLWRSILCPKGTHCADL